MPRLEILPHSQLLKWNSVKLQKQKIEIHKRKDIGRTVEGQWKGNKLQRTILGKRHRLFQIPDKHKKEKTSSFQQ